MPVIQTFYQALGQGKGAAIVNGMYFLDSYSLSVTRRNHENISIMWWVFVSSDWAAAVMAGFSYKISEGEKRWKA